MADENLRTRLLDLNDAAKLVVVAPGVERLRRTLRRRRVIRTALAFAAVIILGVVGLTLPDRAVPPTDVPTTEPPPSPTSSPSATPASTPATVSSSGAANAGAPQQVGLEPYFLEYGDGLSTVVGQDTSVNLPIGVMTWGSGTATGVVLTVDLAQITSKVDIVAISSPCGRSGSTVTCDFGTLKISGPKKFGATLTLRGKPGVPEGRAGTVLLTLAASPRPGVASATGRVDVAPAVADLVMTSSQPVANVGQTATVTYTVKNQGPTLQPWATLGAGGVQPGTHYVGGDGCTFTATTFDCRIDNLAVGQTRVVKVTVAIDSCPPRGDTSSAGVSWGAYLSDPNTWNNEVQMVIRVRGCS